MTLSSLASRASSVTSTTTLLDPASHSPVAEPLDDESLFTSSTASTLSPATLSLRRRVSAALAKQIPDALLATNPCSILIHLFLTLQCNRDSVLLDTNHVLPILKYCGVPAALEKALIRKCLAMDTTVALLTRSASASTTTVQTMSTDNRSMSTCSTSDTDSSSCPLDQTLPAQTLTWIQLSRFWAACRWESLDVHARCFHLIKALGRHHILSQDFELPVEDAIRAHPAFEFLISASASFIERYVETVSARLFYIKTNSSSPHMTLREFVRIDFPSLLDQLDSCTTSLEAKVPSVFSYKDFYVIYCKFWELDRDHDLMLTKADLERFENFTLSQPIIDRILEWTRIRRMRKDRTAHHMDFKDFVTFILSVVDKTTDAALAYWFSCLDVDGDGVLSFMELEIFWTSQCGRIRESYSMSDFCSILLDILRLPSSSCLTLADLKRNREGAGVMLDLLFDSRRRTDHIRRVSDVNFRRRDEIWCEIPIYPQDQSCDEDAIDMDATPVEFKRIRLQGWEKYSERNYRELTMTEQVQQQQQQHQHQQSQQAQQQNHQQQQQSRAASLFASTSDGQPDADLEDGEIVAESRAHPLDTLDAMDESDTVLLDASTGANDHDHDHDMQVDSDTTAVPASVTTVMTTVVPVSVDLAGIVVSSSNTADAKSVLMEYPGHSNGGGCDETDMMVDGHHAPPDTRTAVYA
ncbi:hypothetical protein BC831DRAFT_456017 [Entophlyctis helioformis]|nr:hypothetical protein BC831DRAFT_456017 [Entophlyctis helioformis]